MTEIRNRWVLTIVLLAMAARVVAALAVGDSFKFADEAIYVDTARRLGSGAGFGAGYNRVPAYPALLAAMFLGMPVSVGAVRLGQAVIAGAGAWIVVVLGERIVGRGAATAAGLLYALDPLLVIASGLLYPETLASLTLALVVWWAIDGSERDDPRRTALAGLALGLLTLLRPVALLLPPVVAGWIGLTVRAVVFRRLVHVAALGLAFGLVLTPWVVRNLSVHGRVIPVATAGTQTAPVPRDEVARAGLARALGRWAWDCPGAFASWTGRQFLHFWELSPSGMSTDDAAKRVALHQRDRRLPLEPIFPQQLRDVVSAWSSGLELALALMGLALVKRRRWRTAILPLAVILTFAGGHALFVATLRYRISVLPLVFLFTGVAIASLAERWRRRNPAAM